MSHPAWRVVLVASLIANMVVVAKRVFSGGEHGKTQSSLGKQATTNAPTTGFAQAVAATNAELLGGCIQRLHKIENDFAQAKANFDAETDSAKRFAAGARSAALEQRVKPAIERALSRLDVPSAVECRDQTCQVHVSATSRAQAHEAWKLVADDPDLKKLASSFRRRRVTRRSTSLARAAMTWIST